MKDQRIVDHYADMDVDELEMELEDLHYAIIAEKEKMRVCGFLEQQLVHKENVKRLRAERAYVRKCLKGLIGE